MSRMRDILGIDGRDLTLHLGVTVVVAVIVGGAGGEFNYDGEAVATLFLAASAAILGVRMFLGRRNRPRTVTGADQTELREMDERLYELEQAQARLHELEERVDFAERLLVSKRETPPRVEDDR